MASKSAAHEGPAASNSLLKKVASEFAWLDAVLGLRSERSADWLQRSWVQTTYLAATPSRFAVDDAAAVDGREVDSARDAAVRWRAWDVCFATA